MAEIVTTLITVFGSGIFSLIICLITQSKNMTLIEYRLSQIEKKLDKTEGLELRIVDLENKIKNMEDKT